MSQPKHPETQDPLTAITHIIFDVDGVMTDGKLHLNAQGEETYKTFHVRDGFGLRLLQQANIHIAVISGRQSDIVTQRLHDLGITEIYQGVTDKSQTYAAYKQHHNLQDQQIAYLGDDLIDLPVMRQVGLAIAVADAHPRVKQCAHWYTEQHGGCGAVREVCEWLLAAQGHQAVLENF